MHRVLYNKKELIETFISNEDVVLDVGFFGQNLTVENPDAPHNQLKRVAKEVYALDLDFDRSAFPDEVHYVKASAEDFDFGELKFDVVFAGDLIEHLSNPGLFLEAAKRALKPGGLLLVTTPNCFNMWNVLSKITHYEPVVNKDHTCYFNEKTIRQLYGKNGWEVEEFLYLYTLDIVFKESFKKKIASALYWFFSKFTTKFLEPMVIVARKQ